jgi:hypothetical protein
MTGSTLPEPQETNWTGVFGTFYADWMEAKRKREAAVAYERNVIKRADKAGIPIKQMKQAEAMRAAGHETVSADARNLEIIGRLMGLPLYAQGSLFPDEQQTATALPTVATEQAKQAGYDCGKSGGSRVDDNPFPAGAENYVAFDAGYLAGQQAIADGMARVPKKANSAKEKPDVAKKRGRPPVVKLVPNPPRPEDFN